MTLIASTQRVLDSLVGVRIDKAYTVEETGLIVLSCYGSEGRSYLACAIGPTLEGVGLARSAPRVRDDSRGQIAASLRAHIVDHRVRSVHIEDGVVWLTVGGDGAIARCAITPGRKGGVEIFAVDGRRVCREGSADAWVAHWEGSYEPDSRGDWLVTQSDTLMLGRRKVALLRTVRHELAARTRRVDAVRRDLARLGDIGRLQRVGRLLLAQGHGIARGVTSATLEDWEEGGTIEVALDPNRPAKSQAETFFHKARRLQRGEKVMRKRLGEAELARSALERLLVDCDRADPAMDEAWRGLLQRCRSLGVKPSANAEAGREVARVKSAERQPFTCHLDETGRKILVGRGGADNDALTTRHARPWDLWLHAKGHTGAHVIVPLDKNQSCPAETLIDAATLAVHYSDARGEALCEVSYVVRKYVRKPRGSAPGAVTFDHEKVLVLRTEPERLERLLASKDIA
ncbi:MAG: NFACT RNA binding domain-containing protein [Deltaproteobacteria bacterium]|nr:NFACT RNA binding domain-containing protein [Deltaproteobacteria bacterium]